MVFESFSFRVNNQGTQVLNISCFIVGADSNFIERVPADRVATGGLKFQYMLANVFAITGGERPEFAF